MKAILSKKIDGRTAKYRVEYRAYPSSDIIILNVENWDEAKKIWNDCRNQNFIQCAIFNKRTGDCIDAYCHAAGLPF